MSKNILLLIFLLTGIIPVGFSQDITYSSDQEPFVQLARSELNTAMTAAKGSLNVFGIESQIKGSFTFDLTIRGKGEMATVFVVGTEDGTIKMQNSLKDKLKSFRFSFKMPKGKSFKFQYTFQFS